MTSVRDKIQKSAISAPAAPAAPNAQAPVGRDVPMRTADEFRRLVRSGQSRIRQTVVTHTQEEEHFSTCVPGVPYNDLDEGHGDDHQRRWSRSAPKSPTSPKSPSVFRLDGTSPPRQSELDRHPSTKDMLKSGLGQLRNGIRRNRDEPSSDEKDPLSNLQITDKNYAKMRKKMLAKARA